MIIWPHSGPGQRDGEKQRFGLRMDHFGTLVLLSVYVDSFFFPFFFFLPLHETLCFPNLVK